MGEFSQQLKNIMQIRGISQSELCETTGISKSALSQYLSGAFKPKQERTYLLAKALRTTPEYLMGLTDDPEGNLPEIEKLPPQDQMREELMNIYDSITEEKRRELLSYAKFAQSRESHEE